MDTHTDNPLRRVDHPDDDQEAQGREKRRKIEDVEDSSSGSSVSTVPQLLAEGTVEDFIAGLRDDTPLSRITTPQSIDPYKDEVPPPPKPLDPIPPLESINGLQTPGPSPQLKATKDVQTPGEITDKQDPLITTLNSSTASGSSKKPPRPDTTTLPKKDDKYYLRKYGDQAPSFTVHIYYGYLRINDAGLACPFKGIGKLLLLHLKRQSIPHEITDQLHRVPWYGGCLIVRVVHHQEEYDAAKRFQYETFAKAPNVDCVVPTPYAVHNIGSTDQAVDIRPSDPKKELILDGKKCIAWKTVLYPTHESQVAEFEAIYQELIKTGVAPTEDEARRIVHEFEAALINAGTPDLILDEANDLEDAQNVMQKQAEGRNFAPPPDSNRSANEAEKRLSERTEHEIEQFMLLLDEQYALHKNDTEAYKKYFADQRAFLMSILQISRERYDHYRDTHSGIALMSVLSQLGMKQPVEGCLTRPPPPGEGHEKAMSIVNDQPMTREEAMKMALPPELQGEPPAQRMTKASPPQMSSGSTEPPSGLLPGRRPSFKQADRGTSTGQPPRRPQQSSPSQPSRQKQKQKQQQQQQPQPQTKTTRPAMPRGAGTTGGSPPIAPAPAAPKSSAAPAPLAPAAPAPAPAPAPPPIPVPRFAAAPGPGLAPAPHGAAPKGAPVNPFFPDVVLPAAIAAHRFQGIMGNPRIAQQALLRRQQIEEEMRTQKMPPRAQQPINNEIQGKAIQSEMAGAARGPPVPVVHPAVANVAAGTQPPQNPVAAMHQNANIAASMAQAANQPHPPPGAPIPAGIQQAPAAVQAAMPPQGHLPAPIQAAVPIAPAAGGHPPIAAHPTHPAQPMAQTGAPVAMMPAATVPPAAPGAAPPVPLMPPSNPMQAAAMQAQARMMQGQQPGMQQPIAPPPVMPAQPSILPHIQPRVDVVPAEAMTNGQQAAAAASAAMRPPMIATEQERAMMFPPPPMPVTSDGRPMEVPKNPIAVQQAALNQQHQFQQQQQQHQQQQQQFQRQQQQQQQQYRFQLQQQQHQQQQQREQQRQQLIIDQAFQKAQQQAREQADREAQQLLAAAEAHRIQAEQELKVREKLVEQHISRTPPLEAKEMVKPHIGQLNEGQKSSDTDDKADFDWNPSSDDKDDVDWDSFLNRDDDDDDE